MTYTSPKKETVYVKELLTEQNCLSASRGTDVGKSDRVYQMMKAMCAVGLHMSNEEDRDRHDCIQMGTEYL